MRTLHTDIPVCGTKSLLGCVMSALLVLGCGDTSAGSQTFTGGCGDDGDCDASMICNTAVGECQAFCGSSSCTGCVCESGLQCVFGSGCVAPAPVGDLCMSDEECMSNNCGGRDGVVFSLDPGVCRVAVGDPCTSENCDRCLTHEDGWSYCSRDCTDLPNDVCGEGRCIGNNDAFGTDPGFFTCTPPCDVDCPTQCSNISGGGQFCDCEPDVGGCEVPNPPRELGDPCRADSQCDSLDCYNVVLCGGDFCDAQIGRCSVGCDSNDECPDDHRCVGIFCDENGVTGCSKEKCLPLCDDGSCEIGFCELRRPVEGSDTMVCDVRR